MRVLGLFVAAVLSGCSGLHSNYVSADRLTYEAVAPEYLDYLEADPDLSTEERDRRLRTLESWEARVVAAEEALRE